MSDCADGCLSVRLGPINFATTHGDRDAPDGYLLSLHSLQGWDDSVDDVTTTEQHWSGDGLTAGLDRLTARHLKLSGLVLADERFGPRSPSAAADAIKRLRRSTLAIVERGGVARECDVRLADLQVSRVPGAAEKAIYTLTLTADDPLRHGSGYVDVPMGTTLMPNCGDRQAWPLIEVTGPLMLSVKHPGGTLTVAVPNGPHVIDNRAGAVWNSSGGRVANRASGPWAYVMPRGSEWTVGGMSASGSVRVRRWQAWS